VKKTVGRFQLEAPRAYNCKQILGLCQSNRGNLELYISIVRSPVEKCYMSNVTVITSGELNFLFKGGMFIIQLQNNYVNNYQRKSMGLLIDCRFNLP
jgi:hypothetical protein